MFDSNKLKYTVVELSVEDKKELHTLFWKVHGHGYIPSNKFMGWLVKDYIAQKKGFKVKWVVVACTTSKLIIQKKTLAGLGNGSSILHSDAFEGSDRSFGASNASNGHGKWRENFGPPTTLGTILHIVDKHDIQKVEDVLTLKHDLWLFAKARGRQLEDKKKDLNSKLVGTKYNMDERKKVADKSRLAMNAIETRVCELERMQRASQLQVSIILYPWFFLFHRLRSYRSF